jgi:hypothetical protein
MSSIVVREHSPTILGSCSLGFSRTGFGPFGERDWCAVGLQHFGKFKLALIDALHVGLARLWPLEQSRTDAPRLTVSDLMLKVGVADGDKNVDLCEPAARANCLLSSWIARPQSLTILGSRTEHHQQHRREAATHG